MCYKTYDITTGTANLYPLPTDLVTLSDTHPLRVGTNDTSKRTGGFLKVNGSLLSVTCIPIQDASFTGDAQGLLLWGFFQSPYYAQSLAAKEQLCTTLNAINTKDNNDIIYNRYKGSINGNPAIGFTIDTPYWNNTVPIVTEGLPEQSLLANRQCWKSESVNVSSTARISAIGYMKDIYGAPVAVIRADIDRVALLSLQIKTLGLSLGLVAAISLIAIVVMIIFIELVVLYPMLSLTSSIKNISDTGNVKQQVNERNGKDELARVAHNFNIMLKSLDNTQSLLAEEHNKLQDLVQRTSIEEQFSRSMMNAINDFLLVVLPDGIINQTNSSFLEKFQHTSTDVNGKIPIHKVIDGGNMQTFEQLAEKGTSGEFVMLGKFQERIPVLVTVNPIEMFVNEARTKAYVLVCRNISEKKNMLDHLERDRKRMADIERDIEFNSIMRDPVRKKNLERYCARMKCDENIRFIDAIYDYKATKKQHHRVDKQAKIRATFLDQSAPYELNLPSTDLQSIFNGYGQIDLFDGLFEIVKGMIVLETLPRWLEWTQANITDSNASDFSVTENDTQLSSHSERPNDKRKK